MKRWLWLVAVGFSAPVAAAPVTEVVASAPRPLPAHREIILDASPKERRRTLPAEAFLRAYLRWFGGLAPIEVQHRATGNNLFDQWGDYVTALGLPDYKIDAPRVTQSSPMMLATLGRLGEALCVRAAQHDLRAGAAPSSRVVFAFDAPAAPTRAQFAAGFDVLHRTFLSYPAALAPADREPRFYALYQRVASHHKEGAQLTADQTAWVAICAALVMHPETELY